MKYRRVLALIDSLTTNGVVSTDGFAQLATESLAGTEAEILAAAG